MYSLHDTFISKARGVDDEFNVIPAGAITGMTYSITKGMRTIAKSGLLGLAASLTYLSFVKKEELLNQLPSRKNNTY